MRTKRNLILLMLLLGVTGIFADDVPWRQERREHFTPLPLTEKNIVFLGNSITNYGTWSEFFGDDGIIVNRGIGWNFSGEVMGHFDNVIKGHPKAVYLMIGINDYQRPDSIAPCIERILQIAAKESPKTQMFVQSILPATNTERNALQTTVNPKLKTLCDKYDNATYLDIASAFTKAGVGSITDDGLHPQYAGYRVWINRLVELDQALGEKSIGLKSAISATSTFSNPLSTTYCNRILGQYAMLPVKNEDILMVGGYLTQQGEWAELFGGNGKVKNRGIGSSMSSNVKASELATMVTNILHDGGAPAKIFIEIGGRDAAEGTAAVTLVNGIKTGVKKIRTLSPDTEIYLEAIVPQRKATTNLNIIIPANKLLKEFAEETEKVTYIDLYTPFADEQNQLAQVYQSCYSQGLGTSAVFYSKWANLLQPYMGEGFEALPQLSDNYHDVKSSNDSVRIYYNITANQRTLNAAARYVTSTGAESGLMGELDTYRSNQQWMFRLRKDETYDIINRCTGAFIDPNSASYNTQLKTSLQQPSEGWTLTNIGDNNVIITCGACQLHQTTSSLSWKIYNWGGGDNVTDAGCPFYVEQVAYCLDDVKDIEKLPEDKSVKLYTDHSPLGHLLPQPQSVRITNTQFSLGRDIKVIGDADFIAETAVTRFLAEANLTRNETAEASLIINKVDEIAGAYNHQVAAFDNEAYTLVVDFNTIRVEAVTRMGVIRAMQTLSQLAEEEGEVLPGVEIVDWPAFKVRGYMHDVGRSYISVEELKHELDLLSRFKVSVFYWHLTDHYGFRFESKTYPKVNTKFNSARWSSSYYTQAECIEIEKYARERGITIIPEIDMPGHSTCFTDAMGFTMASEQGKTVLKSVLDELIETFEYTPYIHIGGDETTDATLAYINEMADYVRGKGKKVVVWNRYGAGTAGASVVAGTVHCDMTTNWATSGVLSKGVPNIDMRYNYVNHFDVFADLAGIYRSTIFYEQRGTADVAGSITGVWNDRLINDEKLILAENNFYANVLATADRAWTGGGKQYIESGGAYLPNEGEEYEDFKDFEERFLFHKANTLKDEPIPYVRQSNVRWCITPNNATNLEEQDSLSITEGCTIATGAGIWLNHIWAGTIAGVLGKSAQSQGQTRYAWTYVYSPVEQTIGAQIEFYNYSRSDRGTAPANRSWDKMGSQVWLNDKELKPTWNWTTAGSGENDNLGNVNFPARSPLPVTLKEGWNKVLLKVPYKSAGNQRGNKWQYTFVLTDTEGKNAVEGLIYSPSRNPDPNFVDTIPAAPDPWNGKTLTFVNVQQDGKERTLYINASTLLCSTSTPTTLGKKAQFVCKKEASGLYSFYNEASGLYMIWKAGKSYGYNSNKGTLQTYTPTYCDWSVNDASSTKADTYYLVSKRSDGTTDGSLILLSTGAWDSYSNAIGWSATYSNLFYINVAATPTGSLTPNASPQGKGSIYNLSGQRLSALPREGVYIQNGRKYIR